MKSNEFFKLDTATLSAVNSTVNLSGSLSLAIESSLCLILSDKMLRKRKNRRYNEETNDEEGDGERKFDIIAQINAERFDQIRDKHLLVLSGDDITLQYVQKNGFDKPILVAEPGGLDLRVPPKSFLVRDVRNCVGNQRIIDVMDVKTQKNIEMSMKDWCKYYESKNRERLLNVISLEFSHTKLDELVESPVIVKLLDWVDLVWPKFLKESQIESTNTIDKMKYPKVQKYCLMSVKGSYTDFHIDFGGTSVWYHILRGKKIFWMVPPTELNLQIFEEWTLSGMQQDVFFGDTVEECFRVELNAGNTFFIPSGWIHAVYTLEDSLVFGGNFLHSFGIENQLKVSKIEDATKVPIKFRYPFYTEMLWYVVQHYVHCLTKKDHLHRFEITSTPASSQTSDVKKATTENKKSSKTTSKNDLEVEDESTESESDDCDSKKRKTTSASAKRKLRKQSTKKGASSKKSNKPPPSDGSSTDIDSSNEEPVKPTPTNTCRMTKNSLLRLQYEVDEQKLINHTKNNSRHETPSNKDSSLKKKTENAATDQQQVSSSLKLADMVLSHESKFNGWSAGTGQSTWSNPKTILSEPGRIHITRFELNGLKVLVKHLSKLSGTKKNLPNLIRNSRALLDDCRKLIAEHENDDAELAVTGKPITPELLNVNKKADMNELIGQFFKPSEAICSVELSSSVSVTPNQVSNTTNHFNKSKIESLSPNQQQRLKPSHSDEAIKSDEKKAANTFFGKSAHIDSSITLKPQSPHKETKCLSPNKKSHSLIPLASSSSPSRPKSPPTRPLSNNQYTSKTKCDNNLLLPGSFADLIAATSTEKKVFDVGAPATTSLFGLKDLASTKSTRSTAHHSPSDRSNPKDRDKTGAGGQSAASHSAKPTLNSASFSSTSTIGSSFIDVLTSPSVSSSLGTGSGNIREQSLPTKPNSPEPPKTNVQKRFITPNSFRPQNKEKLIYASAPYISPVHTTDQTRSSNAPYPWQASNPQTSTATYSPSTPRQLVHSNSTSVSSTTPSTSAASTYAPANSLLKSNIYNQQSSATTLTKSSNQHYQNGNDDNNNNNSRDRAQSDPYQPDQQSDDRTTTSAKDLKKIAQDEPLASPRGTSVGKLCDSGNKNLKLDLEKRKSALGVAEVISVSRLVTTTTTTATITTAATVSPTVIKNGADFAQKEMLNKKPTKSRGPPKKSKEARQVIETTNLDIKTPTTTSFNSMTFNTLQSSTAIAPSSTPTTPKTKFKKAKKQKDETSTSNNASQAFPVSLGSNLFGQQIQARPAAQQSVICGLLRPPTSSVSNIKQPTSQSYLISRPLLFNNMPTYSAAQFQQMQQGSVPLLTTSINSNLGLPLQQGTRIVWATQPQRLANQVPRMTASQMPIANVSIPPTTTTASYAKTTASAPQALRPLVSAADNSALLSLATTALSTAPMVNSPTLSHLSNRIPATQAIMVSSASNQQAMFAAGQQFIRPLVQRLPLTRFMTHPGLGRAQTTTQPGQLFFARLPNQSQPRYLITQPGFIPQRFHAPQLGVTQQTPTIAFAAIKPTSSEASKTMKTKKVKTN